MTSSFLSCFDSCQTLAFDWSLSGEIASGGTVCDRYLTQKSLREARKIVVIIFLICSFVLWSVMKSNTVQNFNKNPNKLVIWLVSLPSIFLKVFFLSVWHRRCCCMQAFVQKLVSNRTCTLIPQQNTLKIAFIFMRAMNTKCHPLYNKACINLSFKQRIACCTSITEHFLFSRD